MDELDRLRELLPEPPPPAERTQAKARARLLKLAGESGGSRRRPARRSAIRLSTAAVAVAAVLALLVGPVYLAAMLSRPDDSQAISEATGSPSSPVTASSVLLDAARRLDGLEPEPVGVYWRQRVLHAVPYEVGTTTKYTVQSRNVQEQWIPANPKGRSWIGSCHLGFQPETRADERAWAADGRPDMWDYLDHTLIRKPGSCTIDKVDDIRFVLGEDREVDYRQLADLPTDAEALRAYLWRLRPSDQAEPEQYLYSMASKLLTDLPVQPKTRAAAFRLLATLPGVTYIGQVRDPAGRDGQGIELIDESVDVRSTQQLIVDPRTGTLLAKTYDAVTKEGKPLKRGSLVILSTGWTDGKPVLPDRTLN